VQKIFTSLEIKSVDEDQRIVEGWASTGAVDRAGDRLSPFGCEFDLERQPIPFLMDHDSTQAVGEVEAAEVTEKGVFFRARIKKIAEPGRAKDLVDYAFHCLKHGLRKSVSVGFLPLDAEPLPGGGYHFKRWSWMELSACAVPCNPEAQIVSVRHSQDRDNGSRVVRLSQKDKNRAAILIAADRRAVARARLGITPSPVALTPRDIVNATIAAAREKRRQKAQRPVRVVRLRP
jgi:uncharacterized protein